MLYNLSFSHFQFSPPSARHRHSGSAGTSSALSIWLSVDPMSDKYPSTSPYTYCGNNPVKLVDPNGREVWHPDGAGNLVVDKGDNAWNLADYLTNKLGKPTTPTMATNMLVEQGYSISDNGILNLKVGDIVSIVGYVSGGIENVARNSNATLRFMNSKNQFDFKFYPNGWRGNQWVTPFKFSDVSKALGRFNSSLAIVGAGLDLSQINSTHSWWENAGHILDAGMGIVGTLGWPGFMIATYYFVVIKNAPEIFNYQREDSILSENECEDFSQFTNISVFIRGVDCQKNPNICIDAPHLVYDTSKVGYYFAVSNVELERRTAIFNCYKASAI